MNFGSNKTLGDLETCLQQFSSIRIDFGVKLKKSKNHFFGLLDSGHQSIDGGLPQLTGGHQPIDGFLLSRLMIKIIAVGVFL